MLMSDKEHYEFLKAIKAGKNKNLPSGPLSESEEQFVRDYAMKKLKDTLSDPEVMAVLKRLGDK